MSTSGLVVHLHRCSSSFMHPGVHCNSPAPCDLLNEPGSDVILAALDCDEYPKLAEHIEAFPTVFFYPSTIEEDTNKAVIKKKQGREIDLSPSTTAAQLVKLIQAYLAGENGTEAAATSTTTPSKPAASAPAAAASASTGGLVTHPPQTVTLGTEGDALFFNCDVTNSDPAITTPVITEGTELKIEARNAEVQGFPNTFTSDAEQFATYNWVAKPVSDTTATPATITVSFAAPVPPTLKLDCHQGRQTTKPIYLLAN